MRCDVPYMAEVVFEYKEIKENGDVIEICVLYVEVSEKHPEGVSYSLVYIHNGERVVGYDNFEGHMFEGGSHHKHIGGRILPYRFIDYWKTIEDFYIDVEKAKRRGLI